MRMFSISLPPPLIRRIDARAKAEGRSRSQYIRRLIDERFRAERAAERTEEELP